LQNRVADAQHIIYRTKSFARWLHGTCVEAPPQKVTGENAPFLFSFFPDISANPTVVSLVLTIQHNIRNTLSNLTRYLMRWKRFRSIWKVDKVSIRQYWATSVKKSELVLRWSFSLPKLQIFSHNLWISDFSLRRTRRRFIWHYSGHNTNVNIHQWQHK